MSSYRLFLYKPNRYSSNSQVRIFAYFPTLFYPIIHFFRCNTFIIDIKHFAKHSLTTTYKYSIYLCSPKYDYYENLQATRDSIFYFFD